MLYTFIKKIFFSFKTVTPNFLYKLCFSLFSIIVITSQIEFRYYLIVIFLTVLWISLFTLYKYFHVTDSSDVQLSRKKSNNMYILLVISFILIFTMVGIYAYYNCDIIEYLEFYESNFNLSRLFGSIKLVNSVVFDPLTYMEYPKNGPVDYDIPRRWQDTLSKMGTVILKEIKGQKNLDAGFDVSSFCKRYKFSDEEFDVLRKILCIMKEFAYLLALDCDSIFSSNDKVKLKLELKEIKNHIETALNILIRKDGMSYRDVLLVLTIIQTYSERFGDIRDSVSKKFKK
jgi:hypothetical protein